MNAHQRETSFLTQIIRYDDSDERLKLEKSIAQVRHDERCVQRVALVTALFPLLAIAGIAYGDILQENFLFIGSELVIKVLCELVLASLICLAAFAGLLAVYRKKLNRLREECCQLVTRLIESHLGKPQIPKLPVSHPRSDAAEAVEGAPEVRGYHGSLDSPSWRSNRVCG